MGSSKLSFRHIVVAIVATVLLHAACTTTTRVLHPNDYWGMKPTATRTEYYIVETHDGTTVQTYDFEVTDTGVLIKGVLVDGGDKEVIPYEIAFSDVRAISVVDEHETWWARVLLAIVAVLAWFLPPYGY